MPSIPAIRQKQRISQGNPVTAISTTREGAAATKGSKILAKGLQDAGKAFANHDKEMRRIDIAQFTTQADAKVQLMSQDAEANIRKRVATPGNDPTGAGMVDDFAKDMSAYQQFVESIDDPEKKAIALRVGNNAMVPALGRIKIRQANLQNENIIRQQGEINASHALLVENDPSRLKEILNLSKQSSLAIGYAKKDGDRIIKADAKEITMSAIAGLANERGFKSIREQLNDPVVAKLFTAKEREDVLNSLRSKRNQFRDDKYKGETRKLAENKREQLAQEAAITSGYMQSIVNASSFQKVEEADKDLDIMFKQRRVSFKLYKALKRDSTGVTDDTSSDSLSELQVRRLKGESSSVLKEEALENLGANMKHKDVATFLKSLESDSKSAAQDPIFKRKTKRSDEYILASIPGRKSRITGERIRTRDQKLAVSEIKILRDSLMDSGVDPIKAAYQATAQVLSPNRGLVIPGVDAAIQSDKKLLQEESKQLKKRFRAAAKSGRVSNQVKARILNTLVQMDLKIQAFNAQDQLDILLKSEQNLTKGKNNGK